MRDEEFLNLYKTLEELLTEKYGKTSSGWGSVVVQFMNDKEGRKYKEQLDLCREIRNLLSHHPDINGESVIQPSQAMLDFLNEVIEFVKRPPRALDFATPFEEILKANLSQKIMPLMKKMERRGFSHVPILDSGEFVGVYSVSTLFMYILDNKILAPNYDMEIRDFIDYIPLDIHTTERYAFLPKYATVVQAQSMFEQPSKRSKRLAAIFITDNGDRNGRLLGMLTPWDVLRGEGK